MRHRFRFPPIRELLAVVLVGFAAQTVLARGSALIFPDVTQPDAVSSVTVLDTGPPAFMATYNNFENKSHPTFLQDPGTLDEQGVLFHFASDLPESGEIATGAGNFFDYTNDDSMIRELTMEDPSGRDKVEGVTMFPLNTARAHAIDFDNPMVEPRRIHYERR